MAGPAWVSLAAEALLWTGFRAGHLLLGRGQPGLQGRSGQVHPASRSWQELRVFYMVCKEDANLENKKSINVSCTVLATLLKVVNLKNCRHSRK